MSTNSGLPHDAGSLDSTESTPVASEPVEPLICPGCQRRLIARPEHVGKRLRCPKCGTTVQVPARIFRRDSLRAGESAPPFPSGPTGPSGPAAPASPIPSGPLTGQMHVHQPKPLAADEEATFGLMREGPSAAPATEPPTSESAAANPPANTGSPPANTGPPAGAPNGGGLEDLWESGAMTAAPAEPPPLLHGYSALPEVPWDPTASLDPTAPSSPTGPIDPSSPPTFSLANPAQEPPAPPPGDDDAYAIDLSSLPEALKSPQGPPAIGGLSPVTGPPAGIGSGPGEYDISAPLPTSFPPQPPRPKIYERMMEQQAARSRDTEVPPLPERPFSQGVVNFMFRAEMLTRLGTIVFAAWISGALWAGALWAMFSGGVLMALGVIMLSSAIIATIYTAIYASSCMIPIIQDTAAGGDEIEFHTLNFGERFVHLLHIGAPWALGGALGWLLGWLLFSFLSPPLKTLLTMVIVFFTFPVFLLSMSESDSMLHMVSTRILKSLRQRAKTWAAFYIASGLLIWPPALFLLALGMIPDPRVMMLMVFFGGPLAGFASLIYARLVGRLARVISYYEVDEPEDA